MRSFRLFVMGLSAAALSACTSIPVSSMYQLSKVDFMTMDLNRLRVAVVLPSTIKPRATGVVMDIKYRSGEEPEKTEKVILVPATTAADQVGLPSDMAAGNRVYAYRLGTPDVAKLEDIRNRARQAKAEKKKGSLSMGIAAKEFCKTAPLGSGAVYSTTYVATSEIGEYIVLTKDIDLRSDAAISASLDHMPDCSTE